MLYNILIYINIIYTRSAAKISAMLLRILVFLGRVRFCLALLEWPNAAEGFEQSLAVSVARQRRSYVPTLCLGSVGLSTSEAMMVVSKHSRHNRQYLSINI